MSTLFSNFKQTLFLLNRNRIQFILLTLILTASITVSSFSQSNVYYPGKTGDWEKRNPGQTGMNAELLQKAVDFAENNEYSGEKDLRLAILKSFSREPVNIIVGPTKERGGPAGIVIKNGYIVAEWGDTKRVDMTFSVTKSYLSTTVGLALDAGLIKDVNDKLKDYVWDGKFDSPHNSKITWDHLLTQTSDWYGTMGDKADWADRPPRRGSTDDWSHRDLNEPGSFFKYNDVRVNLLAYSALMVWRRPLPVILKERIMDPIGASTTWRWYGYDNSWVTVDGMSIQSVSGGGHRGGGMFINTRDHARFGYLFLRNGKWNEKQLISKNWIDMLRVPAKANTSYGYMWWLNTGGQRLPGSPESIFYAAGFGGNYIVVDQEHDLVIVTRWLEPSKAGEMVKLVIDSVEK